MTKSLKRVNLPVIAAVLMIIISTLMGITVASASIVGGNTYGSVAAVQARLSTLGYYTSTVDGAWGSRTTAAVKRFQSDYGLKADGMVGSATAGKLGIRLPINGGISLGKTDANVAAVQARLRTYGYYKSTVDGAWGNKTLAAVLQYQSDGGLAVDGVVGGGTARKLGITLSSTARSGGISKGKTTANVKAVQNALKSQGYFTSAVDGVWGRRTMCAVMSFQSDAGLTVDGVVGGATERKLGITLTSGGSSGGKIGRASERQRHGRRQYQRERPQSLGAVRLRRVARRAVQRSGRGGSGSAQPRALVQVPQHHLRRYLSKERVYRRQRRADKPDAQSDRLQRCARRFGRLGPDGGLLVLLQSRDRYVELDLVVDGAYQNRQTQFRAVSDTVVE